MNVDAICFSQVVENGLAAIGNLSVNAANKEAFGCHIGSIMSLLERHGISTEVMEAGLATVAIVIIVVIILFIVIIVILIIMTMIIILLIIVVIYCY